MSYKDIENQLGHGGIVILDGGTGTELQRRGVTMDPEAWCGPASLGNAGLLANIHQDYISAGAGIITTNTYASSRLMLGPAGFSDQFEAINRNAVAAARQARVLSGRKDILIAGSLSHMYPITGGTPDPDRSRAPSKSEMADAFAELATLLRDERCDLIILEMMYDPDRMELAFAAAKATGLPVWAGFSARRGDQGQILSFVPDKNIPFDVVVQVLNDFEVEAAGVMHTPSQVTGDALSIVADAYRGPLMAYPDSGTFKMPDWQFGGVIRPDEFLQFATGWVENGTQIVGGCCGLSPEHIAALEPLKTATPPRAERDT